MKKQFTNFAEYLNSIGNINPNEPSKALKDLKKSLSIILNIDDLKDTFFQWLKNKNNFIFMIENLNDLKRIKEFDPQILRSKDAFENNYLHYLFLGSYESNSKQAVVDFFLLHYPSLYLQYNDSNKKPIDYINNYSDPSKKIKAHIEEVLMKIA